MTAFNYNSSPIIFLLSMILTKLHFPGILNAIFQAYMDEGESKETERERERERERDYSDYPFPVLLLLDRLVNAKFSLKQPFFLKHII